MENIDDFMQRKFDSDDPAERFPFREEYWEQAQALIEADEQRRRKRRRFLFWWFSGAVLIGAGALWLWNDAQKHNSAMASVRDTTRPGIVSVTPPGVEKTMPGNDDSATAAISSQTNASPESGSNSNTKSIDNQQGRAEEGYMQPVTGQQKTKEKFAAAATLPGERTGSTARTSNQSRVATPAGKSDPVEKRISTSENPTEKNTTLPGNAALQNGINSSNTNGQLNNPIPVQPNTDGCRR